MKRFFELKLYELLAFYVGLFGLYVGLPEQFLFVRRIIAPIMGIMIVVVFYCALKALKVNANKDPEAGQAQKRSH